MSGRQIGALAVLGIFIAIVIPLSIFHAYNFSKYSNMKGEESINYMQFLFFASAAIQILISLILKSFNWKAALLGTIANVFLSVGLTFAVMMYGNLGGTPKELILVYGVSYLTIFSLTTWVQVRNYKGT